MENAIKLLNEQVKVEEKLKSDDLLIDKVIRYFEENEYLRIEKENLISVKKITSSDEYFVCVCHAGWVSTEDRDSTPALAFQVWSKCLFFGDDSELHEL